MNKKSIPGNLVLCLLAASILAAPVLAEDSPGKFPGSPMSYALKSVLFPGFGQISKGQKAKGAIFIGLGAILLGTTIYMGSTIESKWSVYKNNQTRANYDAYASWARTTNVFIGVTIGFWGINVLDAAFAKKSGTASREKRKPDSDGDSGSDEDDGGRGDSIDDE